MESNRRSRRTSSVMKAVRKLRGRASKNINPESGEAGLHYPHPHLSLVPEGPQEEGEGMLEHTEEHITEQAPPPPPPKKKRSRIKPALLLLLLMLLSIAVVWGMQEARTSTM